MSTELPKPEFQIGDSVKVIVSDRNQTPHTGTIRDVIWHHKDQRYNFYLIECGKKVSKRYLAEDLCSVS